MESVLRGVVDSLYVSIMIVMVSIVVWVDVECYMKKHWKVWKFLRHITRPNKKHAPPNSNIPIYKI